MKTIHDPRHIRRETYIKLLYEFSFYDNLNTLKQQQIVKQKFLKIKHIINYLSKIDPLIAKCAPEWPINKLNKTDLAILRLALYELIKERKNPVKVIIDEAIELGKQYGSQNSAKFINGVLGTALKI